MHAIVKNFHTTVHCSMYFNALYLSDMSSPSGNTADNSNLQIIVIFVLKNKGPTKMWKQNFEGFDINVWLP